MRGEPHTELRGFFMAVVLVLWRDGRWSDQERDGSRQARQFDVMSQLEMRRKEVKMAADGEMVKSGNGGDGGMKQGVWREIRMTCDASTDPWHVTTWALHRTVPA